MILILALLTLLSLSQTTCFRPTIATCEQVQRIVDECFPYYVTRVGLANPVFDFYIYMRYGESCTIDFRGHSLFGGVKTLIIMGEGKNKITLQNGGIYPLYESGYYGIEVGHGIEEITLKDMSIAGFRSGIITGQGLALRGDKRLITYNVDIYDNGIGIAQGSGGMKLNWISGRTNVIFNEIGLFTNELSGSGGYTTRICYNSVDVIMKNKLDFAAKSFQADFIDQIFTDLFQPCTPVDIDRRNTSSAPRCPYLPEASARSQLIGASQNCEFRNTSNYILEYVSFMKDNGNYILLQNYIDGEKVLASSIGDGYVSGSITTTLQPGLNLFTLETNAYSTNQCGTRAARDVADACVIYVEDKPKACEYQITSYTLNGNPSGLNSDITIYMRSPAYLNVSTSVSGNYSRCYLILDGDIVDSFSKSQSSLAKTLQFNRPGSYYLTFLCEDEDGEIDSECPVYRTRVNVERSGQNCRNGVEVRGDPGRCITIIDNTLPLDISAFSYNASSTLRLYLNNELVLTHGIQENSTYQQRHTFNVPPGRYYVYSEIISSNGYCIDTDTKCFDLLNPSPVCSIDLETRFPNGKSYNREHSISFTARSPNQIRCELRINGNTFFSSTDTLISYNIDQIFLVGNYSIDLICRDLTNSSCQKSYGARLEILDEPPNACGFRAIPNLPGGEMDSPRNIIYGFALNGSATCSLFLNGIPKITGVFNDSSNTWTEFFDVGLYNFQLVCRNNNCSESFSSTLRVNQNSTQGPEKCSINLNSELPTGTYTSNITRGIYFAASSDRPITCRLTINGTELYSSSGRFIEFFRTILFSHGSYFFTLRCEESPECIREVSSALFIVNQSEIPERCRINIDENLPSGTFESPQILNYSYRAVSNHTIRCELYRNGVLRFSDTSFGMVSRSILNEVFDSDTELVLICSYIADPGCNRYIQRQVFIRNQIPIPPSTCRITIDENIPSGTFNQPIYVNYSISVNASVPTSCSYRINNIQLFNQTIPFTRTFLDQFYTYGQYLHELECKSLLNETCSAVSRKVLYITSNYSTPSSSCNISITENIPEGIYNESTEINYSIQAQSHHSLNCVYSINDNLVNSSNTSNFLWRFRINVSNHTHTLYCYNPQNEVCSRVISKRTYVTSQNTSQPPSINITCEIDFGWNLPTDRCEVINTSDFELRYRARSTINNSRFRLYQNGELISDHSFSNILRRDINISLSDINIFRAELRTSVPSCNLQRSGCVIYDSSSSPQLCNISTNLTIRSDREMSIALLEYRITNISECKVFLNDNLIDAFIATNNSSKQYIITQQRYILNATCKELYRQCSHNSVIQYSRERSDTCKIQLNVTPRSDGCIETTSNFYNISIAVDPTLDAIIYRNNITYTQLFRINRTDVSLLLLPGINLFEVFVYNSSCSRSETICLNRIENNCTRGLNISIVYTGDFNYRVEGSEGVCGIFVDGIYYGSIIYNRSAAGDIAGDFTELFIQCYDRMYCAENSSLKIEERARVDLRMSSQGYKIYSNLSNISFNTIIYSNFNRNYTCSYYLNSIRIRTTQLESNRLYTDSLPLSEGIYMMNISCIVGGREISDQEEFVVYHVLHNDTNPPFIHLKSPPNNSVYSYFPTEFRFMAFDDLDDRMSCMFRIYRVQEQFLDRAPKHDLIYLSIQYVDRGMIQSTIIPSELIRRIPGGIYGTYMWNVSCIDNGDPVGHSETWIFKIINDSDQNLSVPTNFIYPNQSVYLKNQTIRLFFGIYSNISLESKISFNNTILHSGMLDTNTTYYIDIPDLPPGQYDASIVSYWNNITMLNSTQVIVVDQVIDGLSNITARNYLYPNQSIYSTNQSIRLYFGIHSNSSLYSEVVFHGTKVYSGILDPNTTHHIDIPSMQVGIYNASIISVVQDLVLFNRTHIIVVSDSKDQVSNDIDVGRDVYITYNDTSPVDFLYTVRSVLNRSYYSEIYLDTTLLFAGNLSSNTIYNASIELQPGEYEFRMITYISPSEKVIDTNKILIIRIRDRVIDRETREIEYDNPRRESFQIIPQVTKIITSLPYIPILAVAVASILFLWYIRKPIVPEILNKPYVKEVVNIRIKETTGKPVANVLVRIYSPSGGVYEAVSDTEGIVRFIPEEDGEHEIVVLNKKAKIKSLKMLVEKP